MELADKRTDFWAQRASGYDKLQWATDRGYMDVFLRMGNFDNTDVVLDLGCGTGLVLQHLRPLVKRVVGIDISPDMVRVARSKNELNGVDIVIGDCRNMPFDDAVFSKVTARMVIHHIIDDTQKAFGEAYRVLKPGGLFIVSEGVPPHRCVASDYEEIFRHKEERLTLFAEDILEFMMHSGFEQIDIAYHVERQVSIKNWLENSGLEKYKQRIIMDLHKKASSDFKRVYNMVETDDDCFIDMKFAIVTGLRAK